MRVVTRIAPSPTGRLNIGNIRTALFNYLFAKRHDGTFVVRIEDTDKKRSRAEWTAAIWEDLAWLGLNADKRYVQSEHLPRHREFLHQLIEEGSAYVSKEVAKDGSGREVAVVRLKNLGHEITFTDLVRGNVTFDTTELGDFVIARSIDDPLYHFAVVVDDADAGITHVIRGEDHISNTPRQILIQEALGFERPQYAHIPLILAPDRSKLSKRKHAASTEHYRARGYLPEAIINYLALLGWNPGTDQEFFTLEELVEAFDIAKVQKGGAVFDEERLRYFNRTYLHKLNEDELLAGVETHLPQELRVLPRYNRDTLQKVLPLVTERISVFSDVADMAASGELSYYFAEPDYDPALLLWKEMTPEETAKHLEHVLSTLEQMSAFDESSVRSAVWPYAEQEGKGKVLWPMRVALSGKEKSPDPFSIAAVLGKDEATKRLRYAIDQLAQNT